jgi:Flp pilus assembly protein TadB
MNGCDNDKWEEFMERAEKAEVYIIENENNIQQEKPIWLWWSGYILLAISLFAVFYLALYVLSMQVWMAISLTAVIGFIWATIAYIKRKSGKRHEAFVDPRERALNSFHYKTR